MSFLASSFVGCGGGVGTFGHLCFSIFNLNLSPGLWCPSSLDNCLLFILSHPRMVAVFCLTLAGWVARMVDFLSHHSITLPSLVYLLFLATTILYVTLCRHILFGVYAYAASFLIQSLPAGEILGHCVEWSHLKCDRPRTLGHMAFLPRPIPPLDACQREQKNYLQTTDLAILPPKIAGEMMFCLQFVSNTSNPESKHRNMHAIQRAIQSIHA